MKKTVLSTCMAFLFLAAMAQENPYIVKTRGAKKSAQAFEVSDLTGIVPEETATDFISQNFKFYSLCDRQEGMKFMVIPENYDLVVKTFTDAATGKEVSSMPLPVVQADSHGDLWADMRNGGLAYMKAGSGVFKNMRLYDKYGNTIDVVARSIIVEDKDGNEFFQNVAISKTNCGMRDDEFIMDEAKYLFGNSFELVDDIMSINSYNYRTYIGKIIHTKFKTQLLNESTKKMQAIPRMMEYQIEAMNPHKNDDKFTLKLKNTTLGTYFYGDFVLDGHRAENQEDYFGYIFAPGPGKKIQTSESSRAMIRNGHVGIGFTEDETMMAAGEPDKIEHGQAGRYTWIYNRSNNKLLLVDFDGSGVVTKTSTKDGPKAGKSTPTRRKGGSGRRSTSWKKGKGTPL